MRMSGCSAAELTQRAQQQPRRENGVDGQADLGFPPARQPGRRVFDPGRVLEQGLAAPVKHLPGGRQHGAASLSLEHLEAELLLEFLDGVGDGRLGAMQAAGCARVTAFFDDGDQGGPLVERNARDGHISIQ